MGPAVGVQFGLIEPTGAERRRRWRAFGVSSVVEFVCISALGWVQLAPPGEPAHLARYTLLELARPPESSRLPQPTMRNLRRTAPVESRLQVPELPAPIIRPLPLIQPPRAATTRPALPPHPLPYSLPAVKATELPGRSVPAVRIGDFTGTSTTGTLQRPPDQIQTGGFGDPSGFRGQALATVGNVPSLGSFDLAPGPGLGSGTGGGKGLRSTTTRAGFDSAAAAVSSGAGRASPGPGSVREAGFGVAERSASPVQLNRQDSESSFRPPEITFKPNPAYTSDALRLRIQGEVLLAVVFQATGQVRVQRVQAGLGHGLTEAAIRAAEQIRFKPALRNGVPVDFSATVDMLFQLAE